MSLDGQTEGGTHYLSAARADAWRRSAAARAGFMLPLTERMLDLAGLRTVSRVLDVGAGTGEQTLMAAERVGRRGSVLAIDVSAPMLGVAANAAQAAGFANVETRVMDARRIEELESGSFDAAISRNALMLLPEPEPRPAANSRRSYFRQPRITPLRRYRGPRFVGTRACHRSLQENPVYSAWVIWAFCARCSRTPVSCRYRSRSHALSARFRRLRRRSSSSVMLIPTFPHCWVP